MSERCARSQAGFTLVEALVALCLVASVGTIASGAASSMLELARAARGEAAGLAAASDRVEALVATPAAARSQGNDEVVVDGFTIVRTWRVAADDPAPGLWRLEATARWNAPRTTLLTLVAVAP
ncbi:MAG: prepilin-type N-terminal cleavage/methylation domain-containing protein [Alphaproteobacteria bacterium]